MKSYYQVRLGTGGSHVAECVAGNFIGVDYGVRQDLTNYMTDEQRDFNRAFIPIYLANNPDYQNETKVAAGQACSALWKIATGIRNGDVVLCPDSDSRYHVGEVIGAYSYHPNGSLPHRRPVRWLTPMIDRDDMTVGLRNAARSISTISEISKHGSEIENLLGGAAAPALIVTDDTIEDPAVFAMEAHLEDFLVRNWVQTDLGKDYDIYEHDGELIGEQYETDTGRIDILAISKDKQTLLVIELKRGRASDTVVGQILRYMGYVQEVLAEEGQRVRGVIIGLDDDPKIHRALAMVPSIEFYRYQISFKLLKA